ncbi:hypothetical protein FACS189462_0690 [Spirochaetia bacterium]|nr:hypothetical protein FACS189462_0690 [Spirochaetia bacterium]
MIFSKFIWNNFKESKYGQGLINYFKNYQRNIFENNIEKYKEIINTIRYDDRRLENTNLSQYFYDIKNFCSEFPKILLQNKINNNPENINEAEIIFDLLIGLVETEEDLEKECPKYVFDFSDIPFLSEGLYILYPDYFFPWYFIRLYHQVIAIFNEFGIYLPPEPKKNDFGKRFWHYFELCKSLYEFRKSYEIEGYELPAFLYGFATGVIRKYEITDVLPEPRKAYFVGGGKNNNGDFDYLDKVNEKIITSWNGNRETQPGDIIIMYCLTPRSCIHSIWRAVTPGSFDPFFTYYGTIFIGKPILVKQITLDEIKTDRILSEMPLVKGNMQGINGRLLIKKYYDRILQMLKEKGENISLLPKLNDDTIQDVELQDEKDVEKYLLEPLLSKLGYFEHQWKRQLKLRMGRGDRVFPDYVIFPKEERNNESGYWIWEAKYSIINSKQLKEDFGQAKSYALRLNCKGLGLISKEGVWLSVLDFSFEKIKFWSWKQINEHDYLNEIFDIAGNKKRN